MVFLYYTIFPWNPWLLDARGNTEANFFVFSSQHIYTGKINIWNIEVIFTCTTGFNNTSHSSWQALEISRFALWQCWCCNDICNFLHECVCVCCVCMRCISNISMNIWLCSVLLRSAIINAIEKRTQSVCSKTYWSQNVAYVEAGPRRNSTANTTLRLCRTLASMNFSHKMRCTLNV